MTQDHVPKKRRKRPTVVCQRCRQKKAKCDKQTPCDLCVRAECPDECLYASSAPANTGKLGGHRSPGISVPPLPPNLTCTGLDARFKAVVALLVAFCQEPDTQAAVSAPKRRAKKSSYMIGNRPPAVSSDTMNMHMCLSKLARVSKTDAALELPEFIEPRFANVFHNFRTSLRTTFSVELSQQDPAIKIYWEHNTHGEKLRLMTVQHLDPGRRNEVLQAAGKYFGPLFLSSNSLSQSMTRTQLSLYGQPLGFSFTPSFNEQDGFQTSLRKVMPTKPVFMAYVARFFAKIYPSYPIIDEDWLFVQADRLFNFSGLDGTFQSANLASRDDVLVVSMVLFILGLSYLSYFTNVRTQNEQILNETFVGNSLLKSSPISRHAVELAVSMLQKGNSRFKSLFRLLQAHMLKMIYKMLSLENEVAFCDIDGVSGASSMLLLAVPLMLERDPDHIANFPGDAKERNLRRKVWYTLLQIEYTMSYLFVSPRTVSLTLYKTKLPTFDAESSNIHDLSLEEKVIEHLRETHALYSSGNTILDLATDATLSLDGTYLINALSDFECLVKEKLGIVDDYFVKHAAGNGTGVIIIARLRALLSLRIFISYVNYFLYLYYRYKNVQHLSFFFLKKTVLIHMNEFSYLSSELMFSQDKYFDTSFALMVSPLILLVKQSSFIFCLALVISLPCGVIMQNHTGDKSRDIHLMRKLLRQSQSFLLLTQKLLKLLSERYFYAWKSVKIDSFGHKQVGDDAFFMVEPSKIRQAAFMYSNEQTKELSESIREFCPIRVLNRKGFESQCYQNMVNGYDADAMGADLYKTLQTDNFWIVLSTLAEREYASLYLSDTPANQNLEAPGLEEFSAAEHEGVLRSTVPLYVLGDSIDASLLEPNTLQILDMDLFNANWGMGVQGGHGMGL
ncbi:hypothetical protein METBIDRAFT_41579 [Metschnikowia bicuspidata var. bicuspidata NRRL YB-4993]|uniref:Zn(2)-C6 fungal-type domain-containing protein n=1 Tax=Metschnikowia bicuspidata var. bicuspidata NRRL YB-4993 TaxID=869754 RepID=A0A1A0HBY1_9ASCO|nr:hypothetical protein METBIDRAFT_41579 [Metschnikowia bicuspidata var. bicuspidata NRRL YB-4993]OBA21490.1 hypothetical protein METBIDRAFT_41579 [Metschnikowia bicuspidata var. bicuspidata NRRL YB-4993]